MEVIDHLGQRGSCSSPPVFYFPLMSTRWQHDPCYWNEAARQTLSTTSPARLCVTTALFFHNPKQIVWFYSKKQTNKQTNCIQILAEYLFLSGLCGAVGPSCSSPAEWAVWGSIVWKSSHLFYTHRRSWVQFPEEPANL